MLPPSKPLIPNPMYPSLPLGTAMLTVTQTNPPLPVKGEGGKANLLPPNPVSWPLEA
jgi:glucokinase